MWGLISSVAKNAVTAAIVAAVATATATVATTICIAAATTAAVAPTATVVAATANISATVATAVVATALLATAASIQGSSWLLMWGLAGVGCLAEHLQLSLDHQDVGGILLEGFLGGSVGHTKGRHRICEQVCQCILVGHRHAVPMLACRDSGR